MLMDSTLNLAVAFTAPAPAEQAREYPTLDDDGREPRTIALSRRALGVRSLWAGKPFFFLDVIS